MDVEKPLFVDKGCFETNFHFLPQVYLEKVKSSLDAEGPDHYDIFLRVQALSYLVGAKE